MWGISTYSSNVYFDGTDFGATYVKFVYWQDKTNNNWYIKTTLMTKLGNTNLYYVSSPDCSSWSPTISYYSFLKVAKTSDWGDQETSWSNFTTYASTYTAKQNDWNFGGYYQLFKGATSSSGCSVSGSYATTYSALTDREHTLVVKVSTNGGSTYSNASNSPAKVSVSSYKMDDWNSCATETSASIALNATTVSEDFTACYRANTTLKAENISSDYDFVGWYDATNEEYISTDALPGTWNPKDAITLEARFKKKQFTVSYGVNSSTRYGSITLNSGSSVSTTSSSTLNIGTSLSFTASPSSGYQVEGWYSDAACTAVNRLQSGGTSYDAGTLTAAKTVYVKFETRTGGTITLSAGTGGQVSNNNSSWSSSASITDITTNDDVNIYARANTGYSFNTWTKSSGQGSVKTNSASGVFTPVAWEDATVTASFNETMSTLTTANSYDGASAGFSNPTKSVSSIGISTSATVTAASNSLGYTLTSWTITGGTRTDGGATNANPITVCSNGDGAAVTVTANYTGSNRPVSIYLPNSGNSWSTSDEDWQFYKLPGESGNTVTLAVDINKYSYSASGYKLGINIYQAGWDTKWWHNSSSANTNMDAHNCSNWGFNTSSGDYHTKLDLNVSGTYTFTLTNSTNSATQALSVTYPDKSFVEGAFPTAWSEDAYELVEDGNIQSVTINITSTGDKEFRLVSHGKLFGTTTKITKASNSQTLSAKNMADDGAVMTLAAYVTGNYTFSYNKSTKVLTVTYPVYNQVRISAASPTDASNTGNYDLSSPVSNVRSVTRSLKANTTYTFKVVYDSEWYGYNSGAFTRSTYNSSNSLTTSTSGGNMTLTTDYAGDYTFKFNESTKALSVDFPVAYQATFTKSIVGTDNETIDEPTASYNAGATSVTSATTWIPTGTEVAFAADDAETGYTWKGWYSVANPSADYSKNQLEEDKDYSATISAATTIYAVYAENKYTITVNDNGDGGSTTVSSLTNVGIATASSAVTANPMNAAWRFKEWQYDPAKISFATGSATSATVTVNAINDEGATLTAIFEPKFGLFGSYSPYPTTTPGGMPGWTTSADFTVTSFTPMSLNCTRTLEPNTEYRFQVYDRQANKYRSGNDDGTMTANVSWKLTGENKQIYYKTAGYGNYRFEITAIDGSGHPSIHIIRPTSHEITFGTLTSFNEGASSTTDGTGGSISVITTEKDPDDLSSDKEYTINSGDSIRDEGTAVFTANHADGYTFAGWYQDAACTTPYTSGGGVSISSNVLTLSSIGADKAVYAKFTENMTTIRLSVYYDSDEGSIKIGESAAPSTIKVGVHTTVTLTAVPTTGHYFASWYYNEYDANLDFTTNYRDEDHPTIIVTGLGNGRSSQSLTANFHDLEKIYFKNWNDETSGELWDSVYVGFKAWWTDGYGANVHDQYDSTFAMAREFPYEGYDAYYVWSAYVPRRVTRYANGTVAFFNRYEMIGQNHFWGIEKGTENGKAAYRTDFIRYNNLYIPNSKATTMNVKDGVGCDYYNNGYWQNYYSLEGDGIRCYLKKYNVSASAWEQLGEFTALANGRYASAQISFRVDNMTDAYNHYKITSAAGVDYKTAATVNSGACTDLDLVTSGDYFIIHPSTEGQYVITMDRSTDTMKISVNYPVSIGDYRLKHTYQINSVNHYAYSDVIKAADVAGDDADTVSMYINMDAATKSLYIQKCTSVTAGAPDWSAGIAVSNFNNSDGNFDEGTGVYKFAISVTDAAAANAEISGSAVPSEIGLYRGNYYIKTDCAPGQWVNYQQNTMERNSINFSKSKPSTFDYYYCNWIGKARSNDAKPTNVKCVIANDYNNQLSDTLKGDAILGKDGSGDDYQTLPYPGNVRFSYNSYTNTIARTYINGSSDFHDYFLYLEGTSKVDADPSTDGVQTTNKLTDKNNWTYMLDIKAQETARVRLTAKYGPEATGVVQDLIGEWNSGAAVDASNTVEILGGSSSSTAWNNIRIIYDFKTNFLMSAWLASDGTTDPKAINTDVIVLRENQDAARQITFAKSSDALSAVDTVYATLCLTRSWMTPGLAYTMAEDYSRRAFYWVSFPFDVKISDIFGSIGVYGEDWILQTYDGKKRAENGYWIDSEANWVWMEKTDTLKAGHGYVVTLDLDEFTISDYYGKWINSVEALYLYFPSIGKVDNIKQTNVKIGLGNPADYECKITRNNRNVKDSYWHCIGAPSFANITRAVNGSNLTTDATAGDMPTSPELWTTKLLFVYEWDYRYSYLFPEYYSTGDHTFTFKAMHSYLVQYKQDTIEWNSVVAPVASIVARREKQANEITNCNFKLQLFKEDKLQDQTFVHMSNDEAITNNFEFNYDLSKDLNSGVANLWTFTADSIDVAANCLPFSDETTTIPVGVKTATSGDYTFTMPAGTNGVGVILVDTFTGARTNLGLTDYTVNLESDTFDERFYLEISPITQTPTGIEDSGDGVEGNVRKVVVDGIMYIVRDGRVFDARGNRVK